MDNKIIENIKSKVMNHQRESLIIIEEYLKSKEYDKHALIKMPTGTGKTGVIGIISNIYEDYKNILIVTPNAVLPRQTKAEIDRLFWEKIGIDSHYLKLKPTYLYNDIDEYFNNTVDGTILIITIQCLCKLYKEKNDIYNKIKYRINLIIFDEGHREPAKEWSEINREFAKKTILFTATPYRNDDLSLKLHFDKYKYSYSFNKAIEDGVINDIKFIEFEDNLLQNRSELVKFILKLYEENHSRKILIRCSGNEEIEDLVKRINSEKGENIALGCHSNFVISENYINKGEKIYDKINKYNIFLHEDMLIEGFNVPEINNLIMCSPFDNSKSLVQQIGRIVRKSSNNGMAEVYIPKSNKNKYLSQWNNFLLYDKDTEKCNIFYVNGEFQEVFLLDENFYKDLSIPKAGNIYCAEKSLFDVVKFCIKESLLKKISIKELQEYNNKNIWVMCYEKVSYSNILVGKIYPEKTLECVLLREMKYNGKFYLIFYDSRGYAFPFEEIEEEINNISIDAMYNLFPEDTEFNNLKLNSTGVTNTGIYSRALEGLKIENFNTNINERLSYCKNVRGKIYNLSEKKRNRYVGTTSSRINDFERVSLNNYIKWADEIIREINSSEKNIFFDRFSSVYIPQNDMKSTSILIDLSLLCKDEISLIKNTKLVTSIESISCNCKNNEFIFKFNSEKINGKIELHKKRKNKTYNLMIPEFDKYKLKFRDGNEMSLIDYINKEKCFKIFFNNEGVIYSDDIFFKPNLNFRKLKLDNLDIGKRIIAVDGLENCVDEKFGSKPAVKFLDDWQTDSIFGFLVDQIKNKKGIFSKESFTALVCDDLQKEIADFIAIDEIKNKIVLIHCKNKDSAGVSASAFQDVCGQAQKNVSYIIKNNVDVVQDIQTHIDNWNQKWSNSKTYDSKKSTKLEVKIERERMVFGGLKGNEFWEKYKRIIKSIDSTVEVWLFTNGLSRSKLDSELKKKNPQEQINQLMWILYGTQEVLAEVGAVLKVYCCN
ncbi:DEAD/DEAH box helicase [Clostridium cadaveris]|uniref:DEAD/DEAH box helicase n=1 Tax=Clostridium cadaveris TaxID=1529 RepID=UPI0015B7626D|nr:DEAD/DEAH box helicase family protein [Clostridium cadaveris]NWK10761.1 DEAD/DEAH box helicase family protein [Clostridium cadaveris]